jgi:phosphocarrier protein
MIATAQDGGGHEGVPHNADDGVDDSVHDSAHDNARILDSQPPAGEPIVRAFVICNRKGLHARASAKFVQTVEKFDADVRVTRGHETVGGTSIMGLMMLAAAPGTSITVSASGHEAGAAMAALEALITSRFDESD